jgi:hypothetical protein
MNKLVHWLASASLLSISVEAQAAQFEYAESRTGAFVGARFQIPLGGKAISKPRASLAIAPAFRRTSSNGEVRSAIGEGAAFNFGSRPSLTLMGVRADRLLEFHSSGDLDTDQKQGISQGGWIAIGVGAVLVGAAIYAYTVYDEATSCEEHADECS